MQCASKWGLDSCNQLFAQIDQLDTGSRHHMMRETACCTSPALLLLPAGFAFFAPLQAFAKVSAKLNPAMCIAQWMWGNLTGVEFVCLSLAELAGAFVGE